MRRHLGLVAVVVLVVITVARIVLAQRTAVSMLNSKTEITTATAGSLLQGQGDGTWAQVAAGTAVARWISTGGVALGGADFYMWAYGNTTTAVCGRVPVATTLDQLHCHLDTAPNAGQSVTATLVKNGADQTAQQSLTLGTGVVDQRDMTGSVTYAENDAFCLHVTVAAGPLNATLNCTVRES